MLREIKHTETTKIGDEPTKIMADRWVEDFLMVKLELPKTAQKVSLFYKISGAPLAFTVWAYTSVGPVPLSDHCLKGSDIPFYGSGCITVDTVTDNLLLDIRPQCEGAHPVVDLSATALIN